MNNDEQKFVREAAHFLEHPGLLMRMANSVGRPLEIALQALPDRPRGMIHRASEKALRKGLLLMTRTVGTHEVSQTFAQAQSASLKRGRWHTAASFGVGAAGGLFGLLALPVELPLATALMLRSIAAIAGEFGFDVKDPEVQLECLYILSLGATSGPAEATAAMNSAYWTSRAAFANLTREAVTFLSHKSAQEIARAVEKRSASVLIKFLATVASRFEVVVSEKVVAEALPILGALGGGAINAAFTDYFNHAARFHFGLRALEKRHGRDTIEKFYIQKGRSES